MDQNKKIEEVLQEFLDELKLIGIHKEEYLYDKLLSLVEYVYNNRKEENKERTKLEILRRSLSDVIKGFDAKSIQEFLDAAKKLTNLSLFRDVKDHRIFIVYYFAEKLDTQMKTNYMKVKEEAWEKMTGRQLGL